MAKLVLAGGSGFIGRALVGHFEGWEVVVLSRHVGSVAGARVVVWDGRTLGDWAKEVDGAGVVLNLSGFPVSVKWSEGNRKKILESRVGSTIAIRQAIEAAAEPPDVWVNASAVGFYGDRGEELLDESSGAGDGFLAEVCREWERAALESLVAKTRCSVLRTGVVLGSEGALPTLAKLARAGLGGAAGSGKQWMPWIHVDDLCGMYRWLVEQGSGVVNVCAPEPVRNRDFMGALRHVLRRPWAPPAPAFALKAVGKLRGPDAELILSSYRVVPKYGLEHGFEWRFRSLDAALLNLLGSG
jgi:uncharacterized protein (TIGR01777 family)